MPGLRIAFYAPLKAPTHPVPSGDRRVARLLMAALAAAGHEVRLASTLRTWDDGTRPGRPERLAALGRRCAGRLLRRWRDDPPDLWFTYHLYHKAPDWTGPPVCDALGIPYVVAEASHAPKRAAGPWAAGHAAAAAAIRRADAVVNLASHDAAGVLPLLDDPRRLLRLRPFLDAAPFAAATAERGTYRAAFAASYGLPADQPWLLAVGMMRDGDKRRSYEALARALPRLARHPWRLLVVGDGPARPAVEGLFAGMEERVRFTGAADPARLAALYAAADLMVWPAVNEAYGMALLEAQATGLPVVAGRTGGVPDVVRDGATGLLVPVGDDGAFAGAIAALLDDEPRRRRFGEAAIRTAAAEHGFADAVDRLDRLVRRIHRRELPLCPAEGALMTTLLIIRHAMTAWNAERRVQGSVDEPLSDAGRAQVASWRLPPVAEGRRWIASPKQRAWETARLLGLTPEPEPRIVEMSWGDWEGRQVDEMRASGDLTVEVEAMGLDFRPPGGESPRDVQERLRPWLSEIAADGRPAGAVAHNGILRAVYALATGWDMLAPPQHKLRNNCAHLYTLAPDGTPSVAEMNIRLDAA